MRIVHIDPHSQYNEGWSYQENLLPKYQAKLGHEVSLIISNRMYKNGGLAYVECSDSFSADGFRVIRRAVKKTNIRYLRIFASMPVKDLLMDLKPDFIFFHELVSSTIFQAIQYKKRCNPECVIVQDNHLDYNIGFDPQKGWKNRVLRFIYRIQYALTDHYITRVYGVTPWRKKYAEEFFGVPAEKTDVLIMGADDEKINFSERESIRKRVREQYGVADNEFLVVTGGKIDERKKIHLLMEACKGMDKVKLIIFGHVHDDVKQIFDALLADSKNLIYVGWLQAEKAYDYFFAADLAFFPGQHSVLWEQACAAKVPCVFGKWEGMEHVNNGGNSDFVSPITVEDLRRKLEELHFTPKYEAMKAVAESEAMDIYLYSKIAEKSLECAK